MKRERSEEMELKLDKVANYIAHNIADTLAEGAYPWMSKSSAIRCHRESVWEMYGKLSWSEVSRRAMDLLAFVTISKAGWAAWAAKQLR